MTKDLSCPICSADLPLAGDERKGDEVFCTFCGAPFRISKIATDDEEISLEEDF
jgi:hypothetical protein